MLPSRDGSTTLLRSADTQSPRSHTMLRHWHKEVAWVDMSARSAAWSRERPAPQASSAPALPSLGEHLLLGTKFGEMVRNARCNLEEQRIAVIQAVFERI